MKPCRGLCVISCVSCWKDEGLCELQPSLYNTCLSSLSLYMASMFACTVPTTTKSEPSSLPSDSHPSLIFARLTHHLFLPLSSYSQAVTTPSLPPPGPVALQETDQQVHHQTKTPPLTPHRERSSWIQKRLPLPLDMKRSTQRVEVKLLLSRNGWRHV